MTQPRLVLVRYVSLDRLCVPRVSKVTTIASLLDCMCILVFVVVFFFILEMFNQMFNRRDNAIEYPEKLLSWWSRYWKRPWRTSRPCRAGWRTPWRERSRTHRGREGRPGQGGLCVGGGGQHPREEAGEEYTAVEGVEEPVARPLALVPRTHLCVAALREKKASSGPHQPFAFGESGGLWPWRARSRVW